MTQGVQAQINALTETGDAVILYEDGQWAYVEEPDELDTILVNDQPFFKDETATFLVKSKKIDKGIWINPKEWNFERKNISEAAEFSFTKKGSEIYAIFIAEKIEIPVETLGNIALINARNASPSAKVVKEEYRKVNGVDVLMMQISATIQGIEFRYFGYYCSSEKGSLQLLSWTFENSFIDSEAEMAAFLNGLVTIIE